MTPFDCWAGYPGCREWPVEPIRPDEPLNGGGYVPRPAAGCQAFRRPGAAQDRVILDVELVEQSTGELSFGAGYSTSEGVIGDVGPNAYTFMGGIYSARRVREYSAPVSS